MLSLTVCLSVRMVLASPALPLVWSMPWAAAWQWSWLGMAVVELVHVVLAAVVELVHVVLASWAGAGHGLRSLAAVCQWSWLTPTVAHSLGQLVGALGLDAQTSWVRAGNRAWPPPSQESFRGARKCAIVRHLGRSVCDICTCRSIPCKPTS